MASSGPPSLRQRIVLVATELVRTDTAGGAVSLDVAANRTQAGPAQFRHLRPGVTLLDQPYHNQPQVIRYGLPMPAGLQTIRSLNQTTPCRGKSRFNLFGFALAPRRCLGCGQSIHDPRCRPSADQPHRGSDMPTYHQVVCAVSGLIRSAFRLRSPQAVADILGQAGPLFSSQPLA